MCSILAEMILEHAERLERDDAKFDRIVFSISHNFTDEYGVSKAVYMFPNASLLETWTIRYKSSDFIVTRNNFGLIVDIILQQVLLDFLQITKKQDQTDTFSSDLDSVSFAVVHRGNRIASSTYYFQYDMHMENIEQMDVFSRGGELERLARMVNMYVAFAMFIAPSKRLKNIYVVA